MAHISRDRKKLLNRVRRIRGQVEAVEKALEADDECSAVLQTIAATRGALNGLILPITLGVCLIASQKKSVMGEDYHHPVLLLVLGIVVVIVSGYLGITSLSSLSALFA